MTERPSTDAIPVELLGAEYDLRLLETQILMSDDLSDVAQQTAVEKINRVRSTLATFRGLAGLQQKVATR